MNNNDEFDKLMYLLGEEKSIDQLSHQATKHKFSEEYERRKLELINEYKGSNGETIDVDLSASAVGRKRRGKRFVILSVAIIAMLAISITALGIATRYEVKANKNEETGTFTLDVKPIFKNDKVPEVKVIPQYLPKGYVEVKDTPGKYHLSGSGSTGGITILPVYSPYDFKDIYVSSVEDKTIGGVKAKVLTRDGIDFRHIIYLLYENDGQIIKLYGHETVPLEELIKVAENITYNEIPGSFVDIPAYSSGYDNNKDEVVDNTIQESIEREFFGIDEERNDFIDRAKSDLSYAVKSIEVMDKTPDLKPEYFDRIENVIDKYDNYLQYLNDDGTLKEYERLEREYWADNKMNRQTKVVGMKFVYVTLEVTNNSEEDIIDTYFSPLMTYIIESHDHDEDGIYPSNHELQHESRPFYFDKGDYQGTHYYFADFKAKETYEIHLAYAVDEDYLDTAYISVNTLGFSTVANPRDVSKSYIKIMP